METQTKTRRRKNAVSEHLVSAIFREDLVGLPEKEQIAILRAEREASKKRQLEYEAQQQKNAAAAAEKKLTWQANKYISLKEKIDLAEMLLIRNVKSEHMRFIDGRHKTIYLALLSELGQRAHTPESFFERLEKTGKLEAAGGADFYWDIFGGFPLN